MLFASGELWSAGARSTALGKSLSTNLSEMRFALVVEAFNKMMMVNDEVMALWTRTRPNGEECPR